MDISFQCEKCRQDLSIDETAVGMVVECPTCAQSLRVPTSVRPQVQTDQKVRPNSPPAPDSPPSLQGSPGQPQTRAAKFCPKCGEQNVPGGPFCSACGAPIETKLSPKSHPTRTNSIPWILAFGPLFLILGFALKEGSAAFWILAITFLIANVVLMVWDKVHLRKAAYDVKGLETPITLSVLIYVIGAPMFLFKRARIVGSGYGCVVCWLITLLVSILGLGALSYFTEGDSAYNQGVHFQQTGQTDLAEQQFKLALQRNPELAEAHLNLGLIYVNRGWYDGAEASTKKAVEIFERTQTTLVEGSTWQQTLSVAYNNLGVIELTRAIKTADKLDLTSAQLHLRKAGEHFKKAVQLDPANSHAQANIQRCASALENTASQ